MAAAVAYQRAAKKANARGDQLDKAYKNKHDLKSLRAYCAKSAAMEHTFLQAIKAIAFPEDSAADARAVIKAAAGEEAPLRACAKAKTIADWQRTYDLSFKAANRRFEAANLLRLDLNLPAVPIT